MSQKLGKPPKNPRKKGSPAEVPGPAARNPHVPARWPKEKTRIAFLVTFVAWQLCSLYSFALGVGARLGGLGSWRQGFRVQAFRVLGDSGSRTLM